MKTLIIITALVLACLPAVYAQNMQLEESIQIAEQSNPSLQASLARYRALKAKAAQGGYLEDPKIAAGYFAQPVETRVGPQTASVSVSQMFPWFGTLGAREQSMEYMAEAAYQQYLDERNRIAFKVTEVYSEMYAAAKSAEAIREHRRWLHSFKDILLSRYENGRTGLSDVLRVDMELQMLENRHEDYNEKLAALKVRFEEHLGEALPGELRFDDTLRAPRRPAPEDALRTIAAERNPTVRKYDRLKDAYRESERAAGKMGLPSFTLGATYIFIDNREDAVLSDNGKDAFIIPQVGMSLPLYRGKYSAMEEEAIQQQQAAESERTAVLRKLRADLSEAFEALRNSERDLALYRNLSDLSRKTRDIVIEEYTGAESSIDDVIQVERQYIEYQLKLEHARAAYSTGAARINYITGERGTTNE